MAYKFSAAERRLQAELLREQRQNRYAAYRQKKPLTTAPKKKNKSGLAVAGATAADVGGNVLIGLGKGVEGIYDFGASLVGAVGGLFSDDFEDSVKQHVARDFTNELYGNALQEATADSALNGTKFGRIVEGVAQGVGQLLPTVAISAATAGLGTAAGLSAKAVTTARHAAAMGSTMASAAGTATEEAFNDGAEYGKGLAYGATSGVIEGVTEKLTGGIPVFGDSIVKGGKVIAKEGAEQVAKTGLKRIAKDMAGEGVEEMISELADPAAKSLYKGKDAFSEYGEGEYWQGVGEAGVVGALTSVAYGGTVGHITKTSGVYADTRSVMEDIDTQVSEMATLEEKGKLTPEMEVAATKRIRRDYEQLSGILKKTSDKTRAELMKNPQVAAVFESDGTLKASVASNLDARIQYAGEGGGSQLMSRGVYGRESEIGEMLAKEGTEIYAGELTEAESENLSRLRKAHTALSRKGLVGTDFVISKESPKFNAYLDGNTVVIGKDTLTDGTYLQKLVHEVEHFTEGTKEWTDFASFVFGETNTDAAVATVLHGGYGVTQADVDTLRENFKSGKLTKGQRTLITEVVAHQSEALFGDEQTILRLTRTNRSLAEKILDRIKAFLEVFKAKTPEEKAIVRRMQQAERLFEAALERAGTKYAVRELTRENPEKTHVSGENSGENSGLVQNSAEQESTPTESGESAVQYAIKYPDFSEEQIEANMQELATMDAVAEIGEEKLQKTGKSPKTLIAEYFASLGNSIYSDVFGDIALSNASVKSEIRHGITATKLASLEAIPKVIDKGKVIFHRRKGGDTERIVVCAPIKIGFGNYYMGVMLQRDSQTQYLYLHNVAIEKEMSQSSETHLVTTGVNEENQHLFITIILQKAIDVKLKMQENFDKRQFSRKPTGQEIKNEAEVTRLRTYTKKDAADIISDVVGQYMFFEKDGIYGNLAGKRLRESIDLLWRALNTAEPGMQGGVALDIADYIIDNAVVESVWETQDDYALEEAKNRLAVLRGLMHKLDLSSIREEIAYKLDKKKNAAYLVWGARKGERGLSLDGIAADLVEQGLPIRAEHPADIFFEIMNLHREASETLKRGADTYLGEVMTKVERDALRQDIAKEILRSFDTKGQPSKLARTIVFYEEQVRKLRAELKDARNANGVTNRVLDKAQRLRDLKAGRYLSAAQYRDDIFKGSIGKLAGLKYRGNLREAAVRETVGQLGSWYHSDNPLYKGEDALQLNGEILEMIKEISGGEGRLSNNELEMLGKIMDFFVHEVENFNKVYREGKWQEAKPIAKKHVEGIRTAKSRHRRGVLTRLAEGGYMRMFADPLSLMRRADAYDRGFFTETFENLRQGAIKAAVTKQRLIQQYEGFFKKHKSYDKRFFGECVTYRGQLLAVNDAISLYMTMHREQAYAGLARSGYQIDVVTDDRARTSKKAAERLEGFVTPTESLNEDSLKKLMEKERAVLRRQFTAEDLKMIEMMEDIFRQCAELKKTTDLAKQGYTNLTGGYYYPIKRAQVADTADKPLDEISRVSGLSFNKDTVKGAKGELLIEAADKVLKRHVDGIAIYSGLAIETDNINRLLNLNLSENKHKPVSIKAEIGVSTDFVREMWKYLKKMKADVEGVPTKPQDQRSYDKAVRFVRSGYAKYQLGANPKVWFTQLSSLIAATNVLDFSSVVSGFTVSGKDVDKWCELAWLRNVDEHVAKAETVLDNIGKVGNFLMKPIGAFDRLVVVRLFAACQVEVEKKQGLKLGTVENKTEAGKLLERVILDTQQSSLSTERSAAMRSPDEFLKGFTMFSADAMKGFGRFIDAIGEAAMLREELKRTQNPEMRAKLKARLKVANVQARKSTAALVATALFGALIALGFKWLYNEDDEENVGTVVADAFGNMLGGLPLVRDAYSFFQDGFEMDHFLIGTVNTVLKTVSDTIELTADAIGGKKVERRDVLTTARKVLYAAGQLAGIPTRNIYNVAYGLTKRTNEPLAYAWDSNFSAKSYSADLEKALAAGDDKMVATIAGLMIDEKIGIEDEKMREVLRKLAGEGYSVLPRSVGDSVTLDGEEHTLNGKQQKRFRTVYGVAEEAVADMVRLKRFAEADAAVQAKAIQFIYSVYWDLALEDVLGKDLAEKNVLFAEAIDIEKLAIIIAMAHSLEADKDKDGKVIAGSKKRKVEQLVASLKLTAAQKYMVMGYLGYTNKNGKAQVEGYISRLKLTKDEKTALLKYSGYAA